MKLISYIAIIVVAASGANVAMAGLQVTANSALGSSCYSETDADSSLTPFYVIECGSASLYNTARIMPCPENYADAMKETTDMIAAGTCYLGTVGDKVRLCNIDVSDGGGMGCDACFVAAYEYSEWTSSTNFKVSRTQYEFEKCTTNDDFSGTISRTSSTTVYGCAENYYTVITNNANLKGGNFTCSACPDGGNSDIGTISITSCYLPAGTTGSDSKGKFIFTNDCYYQP